MNPCTITLDVRTTRTTLRVIMQSTDRRGLVAWGDDRRYQIRAATAAEVLCAVLVACDRPQSARQVEQELTERLAQLW